MVKVTISVELLARILVTARTSPIYTPVLEQLLTLSVMSDKANPSLGTINEKCREVENKWGIKEA